MTKFFSMVLLAVIVATSSCSGCRGNGHSAKRSGAVAEPETPVPTPPAPPATPPTTPATPTSPKPADTDVGQDVPPIKPTEVSGIDTTAAAALKHLVFETTTASEAGRYLSEFLIIVRAREDSCVRLKVRPTSGLAQEVSDDAIAGGLQDTEACKGQKTDSESAAPAPGPAAPGAGLVDVEEKPALDFMTSEATPRQGFALASQTASLCSPRLFRMETDVKEGEGLEPVATKTGRLVSIGSKVRIWLDEEFSNVCTGGLSLDQRSPTAFAPLVQANPNGNAKNWKDKLWKAQLDTLAAEMDKIYADMTGTYGSVSDVDGSGFVEIFLSPDVNRKYFTKYQASQPDDFRARLIYKPQDLAYYNAETNPTSNEGEIMYMWTPDPAGIYNRVQYPSSSSITSNYAKGYLSAQLMTLIYANEKLLVQKQKTMDDRWLVESLANLASAYYAGNDYTATFLGQYLTSRPQYISLTEEPSKEMVSDAYMSMAGDEQAGFRTLLGWYLHSTLCSAASITPCAKLTQIIDAKTNGTKTLEAVIGTTFDKILENLGLSIGVALSDRPADVTALWNKTPLPAGFPTKPKTMPELMEVYPTKVPKLEEEKADLTAALKGGDRSDRTVAGPFPSKDSLLFQPLAADNDMEYKLAKNSVSYILVSGLIDSKTDVTALFGKGLNVVFVPLGERDTSKRRLHVEKVSESAHSDLRPDNLTAGEDATKTYMYEHTYDSLDYTVTDSRELWVLGSIDNFKVNVEGTGTLAGDSDAFNVKIDPCATVPLAQKATCQSTSHLAVVQTIVRDFDKELAPMVFVTTPDRKLYRGHSVYGRMTDVEPAFTGDDDHTKYMLCEATNTIPKNAVTLTAASPGVVTQVAHGFSTGAKVQISAFDSGVVSTTFPVGLWPLTDYTVQKIDNDHYTLKLGAANVPFGAVDPSISYFQNSPADKTCSNAGFAGAYMFDQDLTKQDDEAYAHTYDNFLMMGPLGYPYTNSRQTVFDKDPPCDDFGCFNKFEFNRQFLKFGFDKDLKPMTYNFYSTPSWAKIYPASGPVQPTLLDNDEAKTLVAVKKHIDACPTHTTADDPAADDSFLDECSAAPGLTNDACKVICSNSAAVQDLAVNNIISNTNTLSCSTTSTGSDPCGVEELLHYGSWTKPWIDLQNYYLNRATAYTNSTYYVPVEPEDRPGYCVGDKTGQTTQLQQCPIRSEGATDLKDLRQQLNAGAGRFVFNSYLCGTIGTGFDVCSDAQSWQREVRPADPYTFLWMGTYLSTDRVLERPMTINARAGEILSKPERLNAALILVPGTGTVANIVVGGRKQSQGKYLLRVRLKDLN